MFAVLFGELFGFPAHATEDFNSRYHVIAVEPIAKGILAAAKQDGTVALLGEYAVKIVYPKCDAAPGKEC